VDTQHERISDAILDRRVFLRRAVGLLGAGAVASLLAACSQAAPAPPTAAPAAAAKPTTAPAAAPTTASAAAAAPTTAPAAAAAQPTTAAAPAASKNLGGELKILQWSHFVPAYDTEFFDPWAQQWGTQNNVKVTVDHIALAQLPARSASEAQAKSGHDIFGWFAQGGPRLYDDLLVDLSDTVKQVGDKNGGWDKSAEDLCLVDGKWKGMPDFLVPFLSSYRKDAWTAAGMQNGPDTWDDLLKGGEKTKAAGNPVGTALSNTSDGEMTWRSVLWSYGGKEVEADGKTVALDSQETRAALEYARQLYEKAMTNEVLSWDDAANNQYLASGKAAWIYNPISAYRTIEQDYAKAPSPDQLFTKQALGLPLAGPAGRMMSPQFTIYGVWNFSKNAEAAKQFLLDYKATWPKNFEASGGYNIPFEKSLQNPPLPVLSTDEKTKGIQEAYKYIKVIGYPGPNTVLANKALDLHIVADMFTRYATGAQSLDQTIKEAVDAYKQIL
jgi:multiple sugar transport system substrate-binding protein